MFTLTDKVLIDRAARLIKEQAQVMLRSECPPSGWGATEESRKAKLVYDRLVRDERDLRMLGKRLCAHFDVHAERSKPTTATEALANLPAALIANAPKQDGVSRETPAGNPESTAPAEGGTVAVLPAPVGDEVHDG